MIGVKLWGGLGNQLFQYAFGLYLAEKRKETPCFFTDGAKITSLDINYFQISLAEIPTDLLHQYGYSFQSYLLYRFKRKLFQKLPFLSRRVLVENVSPFRPDILNTYSLFDGYWQSYKYLQPIEQKLRDQFSWKAQPVADLEVYTAIRNVTSVSLHIRRGDYLKGKNASIYENVSMAYYKEAIDYFCSTIVDPVFYVFSNDLDWAKKNLKTPKGLRFVYIDNTATENATLADLYLMSSCKHHIIANSTFSWWGAWLNPSGDKKVIAPKKWYRGKMNTLTTDLIPAAWVRL